MAEIKAQQFTVEPDPGNPGAELSLRKLDQFMTPVAQIAFGNYSNTYLSFRSVVGGSMSEQMRVHTNGNVGIGTAAPGEKLEVAGTVKATAFDGNLNGSQITTGTVAAARIDTAILRTSDLAVPNGIATLDSNTLVVQDPANATATPAAGKICKWGTSANLSGNQLISTAATGTAPFIVSSTTEVANLKAASATTAITATNATNANNLYDGTAYRAASPTPAANTVPVSGSNSKLSWGWKPAFRGGLCYKSFASVLGSGTVYNLFLDTVSYDTDSIVEIVGYARLIVPPGVTKVRLYAHMVFAANATGIRRLKFGKGGNYDFLGNTDISVNNLGASVATPIYICTPVLSVFGGEYFGLYAYQNSGGNLEINPGGTESNRCYFAMEVIE